MGLGSIIFKQNALLNMSREQQGNQWAASVDRDFVVKYLKCLGLSPNELSRVPEVLRRIGSENVAKCIDELMGSATWEELFTKLNLEIALLEAASKYELQQLMNRDGSANNASLSLLATYNFIVSLSIARQLLNNESTKQAALATLSKITYLLFDLLMELSKRKIIPPNLEVEIWKVRDVLVDVMRELFKGNGTITVNDKSFDGNRQLH
jgi:hypothetical protein